MKKIFEFGGVAAGVVLVAFGIAAIVLGASGRNTVGSELKQQQIVGSSDMTPAGIKAEVAGQSWAKNVSLPTCSVAGQAVDNGSRARCFAEYMRIHALESTGGFVYAQMGMYQAKPGTPKAQLTPDGATSNAQYAAIDPSTNQPISNAKRNVWVTETALTTALNTSYMAEQLGNFGIVVGIALLLSGVGFIVLAVSGALRAGGWLFARAEKAATKAAEISA
jgi:hypothetical protein